MDVFHIDFDLFDIRRSWKAEVDCARCNKSKGWRDIAICLERINMSKVIEMKISYLAEDINWHFQEVF